MPAANYTTSFMIEEIKRKISAPDSQDLYSDDDFCRAMTDVQRSEIVPYMIDVIEGYFEKEYEFSTNGSDVEYPIPARAIGLKLASMAQKTGTSRHVITTLTQAQLDETYWHTKRAVAIRGNNIVFAPSFNSQIDVIMRYYRAPSALVPTSDAGQITAISGNVLTLSSVPADMIAGVLVDIHTGSAPFQPITDDIPIISVAGFDVTIADATSFSVGDWVCFAGQCVIPQIPLELFPILSAYAGLQFLESQSSAEEVAIAQKNYEKLKENLFKLITPRNVSSPKGVGVGASYRYRR